MLSIFSVKPFSFSDVKNNKTSYYFYTVLHYFDKSELIITYTKQHLVFYRTQDGNSMSSPFENKFLLEIVENIFHRVMLEENLRSM